MGYVRFWNMLPKESGAFDLIRDNGTPEGEVALSAPPVNYYASYIPMPVGRYSFKLVRREAPNSVIDHIAINLRGEDSFTILLSAPDRKLKVETLEDTYDPSATPSGRLTIRQYFENARVNVTVGTQVRSHELVTGDVEKLDGLPAAVAEIRMRATMPDGKTVNYTTEVNFASMRHAVILIVPDPTGRCRPRVNVDGNPAARPVADPPDQQGQ